MRCACPSCGVVQALVRGAAVAQGFSRALSTLITIKPGCDAGSYPFLASVRVADREVYRVEDNLHEALHPDAMREVTRALCKRAMEAPC
jgi:hypothetical protein